MSTLETQDSRQSPFIKAAAVACALLIAATLLYGYTFLRQRHGSARDAQTATSDKASKTVVPPQAQIFEDEAILKGSQAIIGGTIENISGDNLEGLVVELELRQRKGEGTAVRDVAVVPQNLAPGEKGRYSLTVQTTDWSSAKISRLKGGTGADGSSGSTELAFRSSVGARRPPERIEGKSKIIIVPRPKSKGEEFINTPDNPEVIR